MERWMGGPLSLFSDFELWTGCDCKEDFVWIFEIWVFTLRTALLLYCLLCILCCLLCAFAMSACLSHLLCHLSFADRDLSAGPPPPHSLNHHHPVEGELWGYLDLSLPYLHACPLLTCSLDLACTHVLRALVKGMLSRHILFLAFSQ